MNLLEPRWIGGQANPASTAPQRAQSQLERHAQRMAAYQCDLGIARDPTSSPRELAALEQHPERDVRDALIRNPNAPIDLLRGSLGAAYPQALLENSTFARLVREEGDLTLWPVQTIKALIRVGFVPPALRELILWLPISSLHLALCQQVRLTSAEIRRLLPDSEDQRVALIHFLVAEQWWEKNRSSWYEEFCFWSKDPDEFDLLLPLLEQPNFPVDELERLTTHQSAFVRAAVARHPQVSFVIFTQLYLDHDLMVFSAAREHREFTTVLDTYMRSVLTKKSRDGARELRFVIPAARYAVARYPHSSASTLARVVELFCVEVYSAVLGHRNTDAATLRHIYFYLNAASVSAMLELADPASLEARRLGVLLEAYLHRGIEVDDVVMLLHELPGTD